MKRRKFFFTAGGAAVAVAAAAVEAPYVIARPSYRWRMVTSWPPAIDVLQGNAVRFSSIVERMSEGRFKIDVFAAGELIPAFGVFDAVSQGTLEMFNSAAYYWAGKEPAAQWFAAIPFGLNAQGMNGWYFQGGALRLWEKTYAPFNLVPRPAGSTGVQMGGWFRKKINSIADYKGLKFRIPGLGGKVIAQAGAAVVLTPGGEVFPALERGVIDGTEWVGPHDDMKLGLHNAARYYYYPGWHEPGTTAEFVFSKKAYDRLPSELRAMLDHAAFSCNLQLLADYEMKNAAALSRLQTEYKNKVEILQFPAQVLTTLRKMAKEVVEEEAAKSPIARKVHESFASYQAKLSPWAGISEGPYHRLIRI
jgi:TRAP-type mannitol/chloroaromatic compound transport system substrate-binding protein